MEADGMLKKNPSSPKDTSCGVGWFKGKWLQKFATGKSYVIIYGLLGCVFSSSSSYGGGMFTTMEKRFKIPTQTMGIIHVGSDISQILVLTIFSYYFGKGHRPRWVAVGVYAVALSCLLNGLLYTVFGPGKDALDLTYEYGADNVTGFSPAQGSNQHLCQGNSSMKCNPSSEGELGPQLMMFIIQIVSGFGGSLFGTLGVSYMDDNVDKAKIPALFGISQCMKMVGTVLGYGLASICLNIYISPSLTPKITNTDPRWMGAFWIGWVVISLTMFFFASLIGLYPKTLPKTALKKLEAAEKTPIEEEPPPSIRDMLQTFMRILSNKIVMFKAIGGILYVFGYLPFFMFMPKYMEVVFKQSASTANLITGFLGLVFTAVGILASGLVISKFKPAARTLSAWNIMVKVVTILGFVAYAQLGCTTDYGEATVLPNGELNTTLACNADCHCEGVKYTPICAYGQSFISPCHAGCNSSEVINGTKFYTNCACVKEVGEGGQLLPPIANEGTCPVDCNSEFKLFLVVMCILKLLGASSQTSNFLISMRSVEEKDKSSAMGLGMTLIILFSVVPGPIFYGHIIDSTCLVWGRTCSSRGNCWLYDAKRLRYILNINGGGFLVVGMVFAVAAWYYVKDVKLFDEETAKNDIKFEKVNTEETETK